MSHRQTPNPVGRPIISEFSIIGRFCFHRRTDSEIFEDAVELQHFLIRIRDELCKNGEILMSPALSYSSKHLHSDVEKEKKEKLPKEFEEDKVKREEEKKGRRSILRSFLQHTLVSCGF